MKRLALVLAACGAPNQPVRVEPTVPADAAPEIDARVISHEVTPGVLTSATTIAIEDEWVGMGCSHHFTAKLARKGDVFTGTAGISSFRTRSTLTREVVLPLYEVSALQNMLSVATKGPEPGGDGMQWTDDYPKGSTELSGPQGTVKLFFKDQRRQLLVEHDGKIEALDPSPFVSFESPLSKSFETYRAFLDAVGYSALRDKICPRPKH